MIDVKRYNGTEEFNKLLKTFTIIPSNTEIVEKTGVSKGSISEIMQGKRTPTKNFIDKFKKGFNIVDEQIKPEQNPRQNDDSLKDKLIEVLENQLRRLENALDRANEEIDRIKNK